MASLSDAELAAMTQEERVKELGLTTEPLFGRSLLIEFNPDEEERFTYPWAPDVYYNKHEEIETDGLTTTELNNKLVEMMEEGVGTITIKNPRGMHSVGVGILNRLKLVIDGSLGYFAVGLIDGPNVHIKGRVGWSCGENMMSGTVVIDKNAGSTFGAAIRGGDLVCKGSVGSRTGIDMKGGTIIVGGGGEIQSCGVDAVEEELTDLDKAWLTRKLQQYDLMPDKGVDHFTKIVSGKMLWNYDNLEPSEKKLIL